MLRPSCRRRSPPVACRFWRRKNVFTQSGAIAVLGAFLNDVRFTPTNGLSWSKRHLPKARASTVPGTARPSALAVLRSMTRSNLVGCSTGSAGFAPRKNLVDIVAGAPEQVWEARLYFTSCAPATELRFG